MVNSSPKKELQLGGRYAILALLDAMNRATRPVICHLKAGSLSHQVAGFFCFPVVAGGTGAGLGGSHRTSDLATPIV